MAEYDIKKIFADAVVQIHAFAKDHTEETFYAFAIDAGMLCLSSEEGFVRVVEKYRTDWQTSHEKVKTRESLEDSELDMMKDEFEMCDEEYLQMIKVSTLEEFIEQELEMENEINQDALKKGNPYEKEEKVNDLRFNTGDWPYQGFGDLNYSNSEAVYEEHYEMTGEEQENSEYNQFINNLLNVFERNKDMVFAPLKLSPEFKVLNAKHEY